MCFPSGSSSDQGWLVLVNTGQWVGRWIVMISSGWLMIAGKQWLRTSFLTIVLYLSNINRVTNSVILLRDTTIVRYSWCY